jgi:hypothetical protein
MEAALVDAVPRPEQTRLGRGGNTVVLRWPHVTLTALSAIRPYMTTHTAKKKKSKPETKSKKNVRRLTTTRDDDPDAFFFSLISTRSTSAFCVQNVLRESYPFVPGADHTVLTYQYCSADLQFRDSLTTGYVSVEFVCLGSRGGSEEGVVRTV